MFGNHQFIFTIKYSSLLFLGTNPVTKKRVGIFERSVNYVRKNELCVRWFLKIVF